MSMIGLTQLSLSVFAGRMREEKIQICYAKDGNDLKILILKPKLQER